MHISDHLQTSILVTAPVKKGPTSPRAEILGELYDLYLADIKGLKIYNWRRYVKWCKENKLSNSAENQLKFKKTRFFIKKPLDIKSFCILFSHLKGEDGIRDLYYHLSVAKDIKNRGEYPSIYIIGSVIFK